VFKSTNKNNASIAMSDLCDWPNYFFHVWMGLVWDYGILCRNAVISFNPVVPKMG